MKNNVIVYFVFMLIMPGCMMAHDFVVDGICYNVTSEKDLTCEVTFFADGSGAIKQGFYRDVVFLPETVNFDGREYTVTAIGESAFSLNDELLSVVMPSTIVSIGQFAFSACLKLKSLTIPRNVNEIGDFAFTVMPSLETVYFTPLIESLAIHTLFISLPVVPSARPSFTLKVTLATSCLLLYVSGFPPLVCKARI
jgi:hypothetical protein